MTKDYPVSLSAFDHLITPLVTMVEMLRRYSPDIISQVRINIFTGRFFCSVCLFHGASLDVDIAGILKAL
jgi:hypothetical protein